MANKMSIITGAGISVESGLKTFRGEDGLWEGYDIMEVASIDGWQENKALVLDFYNRRRLQLKDVHPNEAHRICAKFEDQYDVKIITQNVDDLHERGGSSSVLHLHGELLKVRSEIDENYEVFSDGIISVGDLCPRGGQMRPAIVWFGEEVPMLREAAENIYDSNVIIIVGTSMQVYPAASLISYAKSAAKIFYIDPDPNINYELEQLGNLTVVEASATVGLKIVQEKLEL